MYIDPFQEGNIFLGRTAPYATHKLVIIYPNRYNWQGIW